MEHRMPRPTSFPPRLQRALLGFACLACTLTVPTLAQAGAPDPRQYMHGIGAVPATAANTFNVFFSASGLPPRGADRNGSWPHDVYVAQWHADTGVLDAPRIFIQKPEAQEPVTVARNRTGQVMVSFEDGWNSPENVTQRYGIYNTALRPIKPYPQQVESGGHSGHITAVGDRFVVFYSDGRGRRLHDINVADERREWWPMIAGGTTRALLAWQQFVPGQSEANLKIAILDPVSGRVTGEQLLHKHLQYYTYSVTWLPAVERFLLVGVAKGNGFADLIDSEGKVRASISCMPATVREAGIAVSDRTAYTPAADGRLLQFEVGPDSLALSGTLMNADGKPVQWRPVGSVGLLRTSGSLDWLSLTERGLAQLRFDPTKAQPANATDQCR